MRMLEQLLLFWALGICALGDAMDHNNNNYQRHVLKDDCRFTRFPSICVQTLNTVGLKSSSGSYQYTDIISALVNKTISESKLLTSADFTMLISHGAESAQSPQSVTGDTYIYIYIYIYSYYSSQDIIHYVIIFIYIFICSFFIFFTCRLL